MAKKTYIGADGIAKQVKKGYVGNNNFNLVGLPDGYTQLEYLESTGTQYIDTNWIPSGGDLSYILKFRYTGTHSRLSLFGNATTSPFSLTVYGTNPTFYVGASSVPSNKTTIINNTDYVLNVGINVNENKCTAVWNNSSNLTQTFTYTNSTSTNTWKKYSCDSITKYTDYVYEDMDEDVTITNLNASIIMYLDFSFNSDGTPNMIMPRALSATEWCNYSGNYYMASGNEVYCYNGFTDMGTYINFHISRKYTSGSTPYTVYSKGNTLYGTVSSLPSGTTVEGSSSGSYVILNENGTPYYYQKIGINVTNSIYLFGSNNNGTAAEMDGGYRLYWLQINDNNQLVRNFIPCTNAEGTAGMYDLVNSVFYPNAGTGNFTQGQGYTSVARKIKKAYVGVDNVARPCWLEPKVEYYGMAAGLSSERDTGVSIAFPDGKAVFTGGVNGNYGGNSCDVYDSSLTKTKISNSTNIYRNASAATNGIHAIFAGGRLGSMDNDPEPYGTPLAMDNSLTQTTLGLLSIARYWISAGNVGQYALFSGGYRLGSQRVDYYNQSLTRSDIVTTNFVNAYGTYLGENTANAGDNLIIAANKDSDDNNADNICIFSQSLTRSIGSLGVTGEQSYTTPYISAATFNNYAVFVRNQRMFIYDANLTKTIGNISSVINIEKYRSATSNNFMMLTNKQSMHLWDTSFTYTNTLTLQTSRQLAMTEQVGSFFLVAGGSSEGNLSGRDTQYTTVEAYLITE